jgi:Na+/proline symporter
MNSLDFAVLIGAIVGIAAYGTWRTRGRRNLHQYLKGDQTASWLVIGISVMATQASAVTFMSTPGQGYQDGLGFVQNYFGLPLALVLIAAAILPWYRRLNVYTAYEYLGRRFDGKTRLLSAALFLFQRGLQAGITIYAPAIIFAAVLGWRLDVTIILSGLLVTAYTAAGGSEAVNLTQKYQMAVIFGGMVTAFVILLTKLPADLSFADTLTVAGGFHKLEAVDFSVNPQRRYTFWSGMLGGLFLQLSYFGTDQSQVQRYLSGGSLRESRLGLMFNAVLKIPMQFFILLLGVLVFVFYQFATPPLLFNEVVWADRISSPTESRLQVLRQEFTTVHAQKQDRILNWLDAKHRGDLQAEATARAEAVAAHEQSEAVRGEAKKALDEAKLKIRSNEADYVFITFILDHLPHGVIGLLIAAFFAATLQSKAAELNALASTTIVDFYRHVIRRDADDAHYVVVTKLLTVFWGLVAIGFALFANLTENLVQAANIIASIFYGVPLGMFLTAFFVRWVGGTAVFWAALASQALVIGLYLSLAISYLWYNLIGCFACVLISVLIQSVPGVGTVSGESPSAP